MVNGSLTLSGGTLNCSISGINANEHDSLMVSSTANMSSGKIVFSINNISNINSEISVGQSISIPILTATAGLTLSSSFIGNTIAPASTTNDVFKVVKSGNTLCLNVAHVH